jgi:hypothetical protein
VSRDLRLAASAVHADAEELACEVRIVLGRERYCGPIEAPGSTSADARRSRLSIKCR